MRVYDKSLRYSLDAPLLLKLQRLAARLNSNFMFAVRNLDRQWLPYCETKRCSAMVHVKTGYLPHGFRIIELSMVNDPLNG